MNCEVCGMAYTPEYDEEATEVWICDSCLRDWENEELEKRIQEERREREQVKSGERLTSVEMSAIITALKHQEELLTDLLNKKHADEDKFIESYRRRELAAVKAAKEKIHKTYVEGGRIVCELPETGEDSR